MRSRLLAVAAGLTLAAATQVVLAAPASAACGHDTHPDLYSGGGIYFQENGTYIRTGPHEGCTALGIGYAGEGIDVHCVVYSEHTNWQVWFFVRDLDDGTAGWARRNDLRIPNTVTVPFCVQ
ncbi:MULTISPECIES: hypothetical protein [unclassified Kribbella]|uniref:hypothetical protein n=1 Tax=unclassified Kribbella TaxID=2644121 RepID=UPI0033E633F8